MGERIVLTTPVIKFRKQWSGLCERTGPSLNGAAGLSRRIFSKRKRPWGAVWGILLQQQLQSPLYQAAQLSRRGVGGISPHPKHRESATQRDLRPQAPRRMQIKEGSACTHSQEEGECLNLWAQATGELGWRLPQCWSGKEKSWARPPELAAAKKTSKTGLASLKPAGLFFFLFQSNSLLLFCNYFFFLLKPSSSLNCFPVLLLLSLPSYLFFLPFFLNPHQWDNKTWNCEKIRVWPKKGASQQLRQWNKFHFATPENLQVIVYLYYSFFSLFLHHSFY